MIVIRHAEKPADDHEPDLSDRGRERAAALSGIFEHDAVLREKSTPDFIFAMKAPREGGTRRPLQTVQPLSGVLRLSINNEIRNTEIDSFIADLKENPKFDGKVVFICWNLEGPPAFAAGFGVKEIPKWKKKTFDRMWIFDFDNSGLKEFRNLSQHLLPGDDEI